MEKADTTSVGDYYWDRDRRRRPQPKGDDMKTMTCKQMGGPCDTPFHGDKADEVIKAQDQHLKEAVAAGDETHRSALTSMQNRWKHPVSGMGWYRNTKKAFAALPED